MMEETIRFKEGQLVLLTDRKERRQLLRLEAGKKFHTHMGDVAHNQIIDELYGTEITTDKGGIFTLFEPTLGDYILEMKRGAQVIYPKDLGPILFLANISPDMLVFESGVGSGALSLALLQAGAKVVGYEIRDDHLKQAKQNIIGFVGEEMFEKNYQLECKNAYEGVESPKTQFGKQFDCALLDLPEPWQALPHLASSVKIGGIVLAYTPSITQASNFVEEARGHKFFGIETLEVINRNWHIKGKAIRPAHKTPDHTGFLTYCRIPNLKHR